jgi:hypothetical protein
MAAERSARHSTRRAPRHRRSRRRWLRRLRPVAALPPCLPRLLAMIVYAGDAAAAGAGTLSLNATITDTSGDRLSVVDASIGT